MHIARLAREREGTVRPQGNFQGNFQQGYVRQEIARPVLGAQPPPPETVPLRYVDAEHQEPTMELVNAPPYYQEPVSEWYEPQEEFVDMSGKPYVTYPSETNSMMLLGPMPSRMPQQMSQQYPPRRSAPAPSDVKCYECGGNHYVRNCPNRQPQPLRQM